MELVKGNVAVVTGAGSGIGRALAERFARAGLDVVLADVQEDALAETAKRIEEIGVQALPMRTDVGQESEVQALADATIERFGAVHLVCNNAGVSGRGDAWFGPIESWKWTFDVNLWGVVYGIRAFLPHLLTGGYIVNTASIAGLYPGFGPSYDATKHGVVALSDHLYNDMKVAGLPVGVSVLCPGWVRTGIVDADRNWPASYGPVPDWGPMEHVVHHFRRAIDEASTPAAMADAVADAVVADQFWVIPHQEFLDVAIERWHRIADRLNPDPADLPGLPPRAQILDEIAAAMAAAPDLT